jgi:hypothetical protein
MGSATATDATGAQQYLGYGKAGSKDSYRDELYERAGLARVSVDHEYSPDGR